MFVNLVIVDMKAAETWLYCSGSADITNRSIYFDLTPLSNYSNFEVSKL